MRLKKNSKVRVAGLSSFFALLAILGLAVFCPTSGDTAEAASRSQRLKIDFVLRQSLAQQNLTIDFFLTEGGGVDWQKVAQVLGIDFVIAKQISLGMDNPGNVTIGSTQPTTEGVFKSGATSFTVGTNSTAGLKVYVYGNNGVTDMTGTVSGNTIPTLSSEVTGSGAGFVKDHWGYNLQAAAAEPDANSVKYKGVAATKGSADYAGAENGSATLWLTFGAKVSTSTAPDTYTNTVNINTVATPETVTKAVMILNEVEELKAESAKSAETANNDQGEQNSVASANLDE